MDLTATFHPRKDELNLFYPEINFVCQGRDARTFPKLRLSYVYPASEESKQTSLAIGSTRILMLDPSYLSLGVLSLSFSLSLTRFKIVVNLPNRFLRGTILMYICLRHFY